MEPSPITRTTALCDLIAEQAKKANVPYCAKTTAISYATRMMQKGASASAAQAWSRRFLKRWREMPTDQQISNALTWMVNRVDQ